MFCCTLLYVHSSFVIILMGKRELVALLSLSTWCLMVVVWLFFVVPWVCLRFVIVVFPDHTHYFSLGSYLTKLGNLDIDVILCIIWIQVVCSHTCICSQTLLTAILSPVKLSYEFNRPYNQRIKVSQSCMTLGRGSNLASINRKAILIEDLIRCSHIKDLWGK